MDSYNSNWPAALNCAILIACICTPLVVEIALISTFEGIIVLVCGMLQIPLTAFAGILLGQTYVDKYSLLVSMFEFDSLYTPVFMTYIVCPWVSLNIVTLWVLMSAGSHLEWFIHFLAYLPIVVYCIGLCAGYTRRDYSA